MGTVPGPMTPAAVPTQTRDLLRAHPAGRPSFMFAATAATRATRMLRLLVSPLVAGRCLSSLRAPPRRVR